MSASSKSTYFTQMENVCFGRRDGDDERGLLFINNKSAVPLSDCTLLLVPIRNHCRTIAHFCKVGLFWTSRRSAGLPGTEQLF